VEIYSGDFSFCDRDARKSGYPSLAQISTPIPRSLTSIEFLNRQGLNFPEGVERNAAQGGVSLEFDGICAIDKNIAFLYGQTDVGATLLRTTDKGKQWQEGITQAPSSSVRYVVFSNNSIGWALVENFQGEAGGPITLYRTTNTGQTWKALSMVPTKSTYWHLINVQFVNPQQGHIDIFYDNFDYIDRPHIAILTTLDGGLTWQETKRLDGIAADLYSYNHHLQRDRSTASDGTYWQVEHQWNERKILVKQKLPGNKLFVLNVIPMDWGYKKGQIVP
jgi:photosystem II stability/assembly factor-like uncharacterized protein